MTSVIDVSPKNGCHHSEDNMLSTREEEDENHDEVDSSAAGNDERPLPQHLQQSGECLEILRAMKDASRQAVAANKDSRGSNRRSNVTHSHVDNNDDDDDDDASSVDDDESHSPENDLNNNAMCLCHITDSHLAKCLVCATLPFKKSAPNLTNALLFDDDAAWDWDGGLYDLIRQVNGHESHVKLPEEVTKATVESSTRHLKSLKTQLVKAGLQQHMDQKYTGESPKRARIIAPFDIKEIELGRLLGSGGFSSVFEVTGFYPRERTSRRPLHPAEELTRQYLKAHALLHPDDKAPLYDKGKQTTTRNRNNGRNDPSTPCKKPDLKKQQSSKLGLPYPRYAVKHLRSNLIHKSPDKFKRAAIDLILEGQLLLVLDHPHIVSVRGWASDGPAAYNSGSHREFFLILDKLPTTLEDRMWEWRQKHIKYQKRWKRRTAQRRNRQQVSSLFRRLTLKRSRNKDETGNEAQTVPDKYAVKIYGLLLERLKCAAAIASAIAYMHSKRLIHRDLKSSNIGFDIRDDVKLFDLGLSRLLPSPSKAVNTRKECSSKNDDDDKKSTCLHDGYVMSRVGTKFYMAPEIRHKEPYNLSADVYSYGVVLWEILSLSSPRDVYHERKTKLEQATKRSRGGAGDAQLTALKEQMKDGCASWLPLCPCWPESVRNLISSCLSSKPSERPSMQHVHSVLQEHVDNMSSDMRALENSSLHGPDRVEVAERRSTFRIDLTKTEGLHDPTLLEATLATTPAVENDDTADATESCETHPVTEATKAS